MRVGGVARAIAQKFERQRRIQQAAIKQQQLKVAKEQQAKLEKIKHTDPTKGSNIDKLV